MATFEEIDRSKAEVEACTDLDSLLLKIRSLVGKASELALATPMLAPGVATFLPDDVARFIFDIEAVAEVLTLAEARLRSFE